MAVIDSAELLLQAKNYSGTGDWLDESGNGHHAQFGSTSGSDTNDPEWLPHTGDDYRLFSGVVGNNVQVTLAVATIYDYTVTYENDSSDTGTETSDGSGVVTFGDTDVKFDGLKVKLIDVYPDGGGATLALFDASLATEPFASFTDSKSKLWTINHSGSGSYFVDQPAFGLHTDDYFEIADHAGLDFGAAESFTIMALYRPSAVPAAASSVLVDKRESSGFGYVLYFNNSSDLYALVGDGSSLTDVGTVSGATRELTTNAQRVNRSVQELEVFADGVGTGTPTDITSIGSIANTGKVMLGAYYGPGDFLDGEIMAVVLWRSALSDADIVTAGDELLSTVAVYDETGGTVTITSTVTGTDVFAASESGTVTITATVAGTDSQTATESGTVTITGTVSGTDVAAFAESAAVTIIATVTGTDNLAATESGTVTITSTVTGTDVTTFTESGTVAIIGTVAGTDVAAFAESVAVTITATVAGTDTATFVESLTVAIIASVTGGDTSVVVWTEGRMTVTTVSGTLTTSTTDHKLTTSTSGGSITP